MLKNHVSFLEEQIGEMERRIATLVDDNAEMDFLAGVNERARTSEAIDMYRANVEKIEELRGRIGSANEDIRVYRRALAESYGESAQVQGA